MKQEILTKVALRYRAVYLPVDREKIRPDEPVSPVVMAFVARLKENGFCVSEELLRALGMVSVGRLSEITSIIREVMQVDLNWAPLVKKWQFPTGETPVDHLVTCIANLSGKEAVFNGVTLPCGHLIPDGTFPIERYNGCPFCGAQFRTADFVFKGQGSKLKELRLFTLDDMQEVFTSLLASTTPLGATQKDSVERLLRVFTLPENLNIPMKETAMLVVKCLAGQGKTEEASPLLTTPADVLRYLWFEKTGYVQIIEPKTLVAHARRLYYHLWGPLDRGADAAQRMKQNLRLRYDRKACLRVAVWLNRTPLTARQAAECMHPKRNMWVRFIRALRLGEYSRRKGFGHLAEILDVFYNQKYATWQGKADRFRLTHDKDRLLALLKERPGLFARCLFATMLRFGKDDVVAAFHEIADRLPTRLLFSLGNAAEAYFDTSRTRTAHPITGTVKPIEHNKLLLLYGKEDRSAMVHAVMELYGKSLYRRFQAMAVDSRTMYIDPALYQIPACVGDRSTTIQDTSCALMGTRFPVEGDAVRLFMQWGKGLSARHLDMDLSCRIAYPDGKIDCCCFGRLVCDGAKHSGDIRFIPDKVGTAEYIEIDLPRLEEAGASYVTFACNAYSWGALTPYLTVGWMSSEHPMRISEQTGVAYDPSCVQHEVRISESCLDKGLVFGVLDIARREIVWLEMPFTAQTIHSADQKSVEALLRRLEEKQTVGELLEIKAKAQNLVLTKQPDDADEAYTYEWALNPAAVSRILFL